MVLKSINANILDVVPSKGKINNNEIKKCESFIDALWNCQKSKGSFNFE